MKKYKGYMIGILIGASLMFSAQSFAEDGLQSITAYLRSGLPFTMNGKSVTLDNPVITYNNSTYVKLRDITKLTGNGIKYNDQTGVVEMTTVTDSAYASPSPEPTPSPEATVEPTATAEPQGQGHDAGYINVPAKKVGNEDPDQ